MGESYIAPEGYKVSGIRMQFNPVSVESDIAKSAAQSPLGDSLRQVATALSLGVSALTRLFQADRDAVIGLLRNEKEAIESLRSARATFDAYCDFIDQSESVADSMAEVAENESRILPLVTISCVSECTGQPLSGATLHISGVGYNHYMVSDAEGRVLLRNLQSGEYDITEYSAPYFYERDSAAHKLTFLTFERGGKIIWDEQVIIVKDNAVSVSIEHQRDTSQLFVQGETWAARPEAWQMGLIPYVPAYNRQEPDKNVLKPACSGDSREPGKNVSGPANSTILGDSRETDKEAREAARSMLIEILGNPGESANESSDELIVHEGAEI
jgi:uncharacterized surface anchored protein